MINYALGLAFGYFIYTTFMYIFGGILENVYI